MTIYVTKSGDMWDSISYALTGSHDHTGVIMQANPHYANVYIFEAGIELQIPDLENISTYNDLPPWKRGDEDG